MHRLVFSLNLENSMDPARVIFGGPREQEDLEMQSGEMEAL